MYFTYVLYCDKSEFYIGYTKDLENRLNEHNSKTVESTKKFSIIKLVYFEASLNKIDAQKREKQLKTGFGRGYIRRRLKSFLSERD